MNDLSIQLNWKKFHIRIPYIRTNNYAKLTNNKTAKVLLSQEPIPMTLVMGPITWLPMLYLAQSRMTLCVQRSMEVYVLDHLMK